MGRRQLKVTVRKRDMTEEVTNIICDTVIGVGSQLLEIWFKKLQRLWKDLLF